MNCPYCAGTKTQPRAKKTKLGYTTFICLECQRFFNERTGTPFNYLEAPTDIVLLVVLWRLRYKLSLRDVAEMHLTNYASISVIALPQVKRCHWHNNGGYSVSDWRPCKN